MIVVVIALLGALMLLGFLFLTLAMQEEENSYYFRDSKDLPVEADPEVFFNWGLEQLIVGPPDTARNSVLYGAYKSMLPNMVGADLTPYNGPGVTTTWDAVNARLAVDLNGNGISDADDTGAFIDANANGDTALRMTFAAGSQPEFIADPTLAPGFYSGMRNPVSSRLPAPDADFTYADINTAFLSYDWIEPTTGQRMILPSFHRPQLLRNRITPGDYLTAPAGVHPWYTDPNTLPYVMRPHLERRAVSFDPENPGNFSVRGENIPVARRFVTAAYPDQVSDGAGGFAAVPTNDPTYVPPFDLSLGSEPLWRAGAGDAPAAPGSGLFAGRYDADPDNDGDFDAIWLDLDFPVQSAGLGGGQFVPMWAMKIIDVDALFNLNAHGNSYGSYADADANGFDDSLTLTSGSYTGNGTTSAISQSGPGLTPHEVNLQRGLSGYSTANGATAEDVAAFSEFFDQAWAGGEGQSRNLEWWFLLHGRTTFKTDPRGGGRVPDDLYVGRYGEPDRLEVGAYRVALAAAGDPTALNAAAYFPYPGLSADATNAAGAGDDNSNSLDGLGRPLPGLVFGGPRGYGSGNTTTMLAFPDGVPLNRNLSGFVTDATVGLRGLFLADTNPIVNSAGGTIEEANVRFRFPATVNAVLPLFDSVVGQGWNTVGAFQFIRDELGGTGLHDDRDFTTRVGTNDIAGKGVPAGAFVEPSTGAVGVRPSGAGLPTLYGALTGGIDALAQYNRLQIDEPSEMMIDFDLAQSQGADAIFSPAETARLHMTDADYRIAQTDSRLLQLAPVSFRNAPGHETIRRRFTTVSWDVAVAANLFEPPVAGMQSAGRAERSWESFGDLVDPANTGLRQFPPAFGSTLNTPNDPFREPVRAILSQASRNAELNTPAGKRLLRRLVRQLSFNAVAERVTNPADPLFDRTLLGTGEIPGEVRLRALTPHPADLAAGEIVGPGGHPAAALGTGYAGGDSSVPRLGISDETLRTTGGGAGLGLLTWDFSNLTGQNALAAQEWHARRDRQNLARDLYVLLYTIGGVNPTAANQNYTADNSLRTLYTDEQLQEMAQLAVNIVDAMDSDPVRTLFVYDKNLADGYTGLDDGYANPPAANDVVRGLVAGVERQQLALSEAMSTVAWAETDDTADDTLVDHDLTEWNDSGTDNTNTPPDFQFVELVYTGPGELDFGASPVTGQPGENYRIIVRGPRDDRQFREEPSPMTPSDVTLDGKVEARAIIPRIGRLTAARPFLTIANADPDYATAGTQAADSPRSRLRVNLQETKAAADTSTATPQWFTLAPRPFDQSNALPLPDNTASQVLDTLRPGTDPANPAFWIQHFDATTMEETQRADPINVAAAADRDLLRLTDVGTAKWYGTLAEVPVVEVVLQTRLNPLRRANVSDPGAVGSPERDVFEAQGRDNPWINVDRMRVSVSRIDLFDGDDNTGPFAGTFADHFRDTGTPTGSASSNPVPKLVSRIRTEPLLRASEMSAIGSPANRTRSLLNAANPYEPFVFNSIGGYDRNNPQGPAGSGLLRPFSLWQPHFDREFAGPADVIGVPLYDAESLTGLPSDTDRAFGAGGLRSVAQELPTVDGDRRQFGLGFDSTPNAPQDLGAGQQPVLNEQSVAGSRLLYPDVARAPWQDALEGGDGTTKYLNSWYRLLQYVGTPRRTMEMAVTGAERDTVRVGPTARLTTDGAFDVGAYRRAGLINLNTLRHPEALAGLIDDERVHGAPNQLTATLPMANPGLTPASQSLFAADLYGAMLLARDGVDPLSLPPVWGGGQAVLPGLSPRGRAGSGRNGLPFTGFHPPVRSVTGTDASDAASGQALREAIQSTPLRLLPQPLDWTGAGNVTLNGRDDRASALPRAFFGVGGANVNASTADNGANPADLDFTTRYRLLNKVLNSATHRSNVFLCWIQVDFFHARELSGAEANLTGPEALQRIVRIGAKRGDSPRYRGVFLIDRSKAPALLRADHLPETSDSGENTYSFARDPLSGGAKFPWQDLIIHRQRIQ